MKRKFMMSGAVILALLLLLVLFLPVLLDLNRYRDQYLPLVEEVFHRKVKVGDVRLALYPALGIRIQGIEIADDPAFSDTPFLVVPSARILVRWKPLLHRQVQVEEVLIQDPHLHVIRSPQGQMNIDTIGKVSAGGLGNDQGEEKSVPKVNPLLGVLAVEHMTLTGGQVTFEDRWDQENSRYQVNDVSLKTESVQSGTTAAIHLEGRIIPLNMEFDLNGEAGPLQSTGDISLLTIQGNVGAITWSAKGSLENGQLDVDILVPRLSSDDVPLQLALTKPVVLSDITTHLAMPVFGRPSQIKSEVPIRISSFLANLHTGDALVRLTGEGSPDRFVVRGAAERVSSQDWPLPLSFAQPVQFEHLEFQSVIQANRIEIPVFKANVFRGELEGTGRWEYGGGASPSFTVQGRLGHFATEVVQAAFIPSRITLAGVGEMQWDLTGVLRHSSSPQLAGPIEGTVKQGRLLGVDVLRLLEDALNMPGLFEKTSGATPFDRISFQAEGHQEGFQIKHAMLENQNFSMKGAGRIGWDQRINGRGSFFFPPKISQRIIKRFPLAKVARKEQSLSIPFLVGGTTQGPSLQLDTQALGTQIGKKVNQAIENVLKGDERDMQQLLQEGQDLLRELLGK